MSLNDQNIMDATTKDPSEGGKAEIWTAHLPDGHKVYSEPMATDKVKASTVIAWCDSVRGVWESRKKAQEEENAAKRKRRKAESGSAHSGSAELSGVGEEGSEGESVPASVPVGSGTDSNRTADPSDPVEYATQQAVYWSLEYDNAVDAKIVAEERVKRALSHYDKWKAIMAGLEE